MNSVEVQLGLLISNCGSICFEQSVSSFEVTWVIRHMAASRTMSAGRQKVPWALALVSASLEWLLIFMLVLDAIFSYVITKFAHYCGLQAPCLLCSILDHVLGSEKPGYCWDLICGSHKYEISSLVLCCAHNKLVDVHRMCESFLFSFATFNKSNAETYRLLVGKMGEEPNFKADHDITDTVLGQNVCFSGRRHCSCCDEPHHSRGYSHKPIHSEFIGYVAELEPLSGAIRENQEGMRMGVDKLSRSVRATQSKDSVLHSLSHVGYSELKISSDTESEDHFSDVDDTSALIYGKGDPKEDLSLKHVEPVIVTPVSKPVPLTSQVKLDTRESQTCVRDTILHPLAHVGCTELKVTSDTDSEAHFSDDYASSLIHGRNACNGNPFAQAIEPHVITPLVTYRPTVPNASLLVSQAHTKSTKSQGSTFVASTVVIGHVVEENNRREDRKTLDVHASSEQVLENVTPSSKAMETPSDVLKRTLDASGTREIDQPYGAESGDFYKGGVGTNSASEASLETNAVSSNIDQQVVNVLDLGDAYKIVVGSKGRQLSGVLAEQWIGKDSSRVTEDLKLLLRQLSANRGIEQPTNEMMSPRFSGDSKTLDSSKNLGRQILQQRISLERNESGLSIDGSTVSEIEGESVVDRLKRQVEYDKKLMSTLYRELEEERNASAIASDQAMAMITKLQEEKAALHMEALQSIRMMEEQADYDNEALQKIDDLLAEKEKEVQDLEAELEFYRIKYPNESMLENPGTMASDMQARDVTMDHSVPSSTAHSTSVDGKVGGAGMLLNDERSGNLQNSLKGFEQEKTQILYCLEKLEKTLSLFSSNGVNPHPSKRNCSENGDGAGKSNLQNSEQGSQEKIEVPVSSGHTSPLENPQLSQTTNLASLHVFASNLNKRLKALEAVLGFLEQTINSLRYGDQGLKFIREIAFHLAELRKIGSSRNQTTSA